MGSRRIGFSVSFSSRTHTHKHIAKSDSVLFFSTRAMNYGYPFSCSSLALKVCKVHEPSRHFTVTCGDSCFSHNTCYFPRGRPSAHKRPHPHSTPAFACDGFWRNLFFLAEVIAVWYRLCIRQKQCFWWSGLKDMRVLAQQDSTRAFIVLCQWPVNFVPVLKVWLWAVFFRDGRGTCVCSISWTGMNRGVTPKPCHYVSPGFPFVLIWTDVQRT